MYMNKNIDYRQTFTFPDIPGQPYPVYAVSKSGRVVNFKSIVYPNQRSVKRFTRNKQLRYRSKQASLFDCLIRIGYFGGLSVIKEFPVLIQNSKRVPGQDSGLFYLCDYYFPELKLAVELDSELHDQNKDKLRDKYLLDAHGIKVFRLVSFDKPATQTGKFKELVKILRDIEPLPSPEILCFTQDIYTFVDKNRIQGT